MSTEAIRFPIWFDAWYRVLSSALFLLPSESYVEIKSEAVRVRMGWGFHAVFPRAAVESVTVLDGAPLSRGVHGFNGRWLVNGAGDRIVCIALSPTQRGHVMGFPVRLKQLMVSVEDVPGVMAALAPHAPSAHA